MKVNYDKCLETYYHEGNYVNHPKTWRRNKSNCYKSLSRTQFTKDMKDLLIEDVTDICSTT